MNKKKLEQKTASDTKRMLCAGMEERLFPMKDEADGISVKMWEEAGPFTKEMLDQIKKEYPATIRNISLLSADKSRPFIELFFGDDST